MYIPSLSLHHVVLTRPPAHLLQQCFGTSPKACTSRNMTLCATTLSECEIDVFCPFAPRTHVITMLHWRLAKRFLGAWESLSLISQIRTRWITRLDRITVQQILAPRCRLRSFEIVFAVDRRLRACLFICSKGLAAGAWRERVKVKSKVHYILPLKQNFGPARGKLEETKIIIREVGNTGPTQPIETPE